MDAELLNPCAVCGHDLTEHKAWPINCTVQVPFGSNGCTCQCQCGGFHFQLGYPMTPKQIIAVSKLFEAIEHIGLPLNLKQDQAEAYNELTYAVVRLKTELNWDE